MTKTESDKKAGDDFLIKALFWASSVWTLTQVFFLIRFSVYGGKDIPAYFTTIWLTVITTYAAKIRASRWGTAVKNQRWGEIYVFLVWATCLFLYFWNMLIPGTVQISDQLVTSCICVTSLFIGSEMLKAIDSSIQKRKTKSN